MNLIYLSLIFLCLNNFLNAQVKNQDDLLVYKPLDSYVELKGGDFMMGINDREGFNFEYPQRKGIVKPMRVMLYPVSVASFKRYKQQKYKHRTDAELAGHSWVFKQSLNEKAKLNDRIDLNDVDLQESIKNEMVSVVESRWNRPEGGVSLINDRLDHPVVHVSYSDAKAYCAWKGMRLPTEIEWEYAARGGLKEKVYPWGDYWEIKRTNLWQGKFPSENQLRDGHFGISPVNAFQAQNNYEMYDLIGNVWEWTSTIFRNTTNKLETKTQRRCLKGGSFLDARDGDYRTNSKLKIRLSSRIGRDEKFTAQNVGFRCVQQIQDFDVDKFIKNLGGKNFRVVKLRPPVYHRHEDIRPAQPQPAADTEDKRKRKIIYKTEL